jgi:hypothetical protein
MNSMHAYEKIPLFSAGLALGIALLLIHAFMLVKSKPVMEFFRKFHRNDKLGRVILGVGMLWFWLLLAPEGNGILNYIAMDMTEFNGAKPVLRWLTPVIFVLVASSVQEYLAVRALGLLCLLAAQPFLEAAFQELPISRLLIPLWCYALIISSLFWVGMPYTFRNLIMWATASQRRWQMLCAAGAAYGAAMIACAMCFWKGF